MGSCSISTISLWSINGTWPEGLLASIISSGSLRFWCSSHLSMAPSMKGKCLKKRATPRKCPPVGSSVVGANSLVLPAIVILFLDPVIEAGYPFASLSPCQWTSLKVSPIMNRIGWWRFILRCIRKVIPRGEGPYLRRGKTFQDLTAHTGTGHFYLFPSKTLG